MIPSKFYYISSGALNAMRTLRHVVSVPEAGFFKDTYICNLARDFDTAVEKAREMIGTKANLQATNFELDVWGDKIKPWMRSQLAMINNGIMPFGKHKGSKIEDLDEGYIRWWIKQDAENPVSQALVQKFTDIANERDLFAKWEAEEAEKEAKRAEKLEAMSYVGKVGKRMEVFLRCDKVLTFEGYYGLIFMNICVDRHGNKFVYKGSKCWEEGKYYKAKVTIKAHEEYKGERQNIVSRPTVIEVVENEVEAA
jgi:uncharacterized protein (DUF3820 family)